MRAETSMETSGRRVVVTGVGLCVPTGPGSTALWKSALAGRSARRTDGPGGYPRAPIEDFDPRSVVDRKKALKLMGQNMQFALGAAREAWQDSGREPRDLAFEESGVLLGARVRPGDFDEIVRVAAGSLEDGRFSWRRLGEEGASAIFPLSMLRNLPNLVTAQVAIQLGLRGFSDTLTSGEASGLQAVGEACEVVRRGDAAVMLAGGADDLLDPITFGSALSEGWVDEDGGVLLGQGAAMVVLEEREHALARGAHVLAEVLGFGEAFGAAGDPAAHRDALRRALHRAGRSPAEVTAVWLDVAGLPERDEGWGEALRQVFGELPEPPWHCGQTPRVGHLGAAAGSLELACALLALRHGRLPPGAASIQECALSVPEEPVEVPTGATMLVHSTSLSGCRAALVLAGGDGA